MPAAKRSSAAKSPNDTAASSWLVGASAVLVVSVLVWDNLSQRRRASELAQRLTHAEHALNAYTRLEPRADNPTWQEDLHAERLARDETEASEAFRDALFAPSNRFPHGHNTSGWDEHVRRATPSAFEADAARAVNGEAEDPQRHRDDTVPAWCSGSPDLSEIVISEAELHPPDGAPLSLATRARAHRALTECGYVYLDNMFPREQVLAWRAAYESMRSTEEGEAMRYPCQGAGRVEHMVPFRPPFNTSAVYSDSRLLAILTDFLKEQFKLELMTIITSPPGSKHQRWHQGWRYLFHPEERLPPYAVVVALPLGDVSHEMGLTEMCPGYKRRFYHGWRCHERSIRLASTAGTVVIFDYKTLHRGPANEAADERPMVSMVFSKMFFLNAEAVINRGISLVQTLHQRRYWEQWTWHPRTVDEQFVV